MQLEFVGLIGFVLVLLMMALGLPIGISFMAVGFLGLTYMHGLDSSISALARIPLYWAGEYNFTTVPLFILMGLVTSNSGIASELYSACQKWFGRLRGGLAMTTIVASGVFGAVCGSSVAGAAAMSSICYPEMKKRNYDEGLASACVASGGTLSIIIPPSLGFIIYGIISEQSIGKLFIAGIIPGIIQVIGYLVLIYLLVSRNPKLAPGMESAVALKEKFTSLLMMWPVLILFGIVLGGIYFGVITSIEAGGVGAISAIVLTAATKKLTFKILIDSLKETARITAIIFLLVMGAMVFNLFIAQTYLPDLLKDALGGIGSPTLIILFMMLSYLLLGCFIDTNSMILLTLPLYLPTLVANNLNLIWFGVLLVVMAETALITPPIGMNVFIVQGYTKLRLERIFKSITPFIVVNVVLVILLILFPKIATFLPQMMSK